MRKIVAGLAISLGGVAEAPGGLAIRLPNQRTGRVSNA